MRTYPFLLVLFSVFRLSAFSQSYNYYYGNIHGHSSYSDGNKDSTTSLMTTPLQDYNYAKQSQHVDFYGISEHNHLSAGMTTPAHFHQGIADAAAVNTDGVFVALYGQEWGVISGGGHVILYGCDSLFGWDANDYDVYVPQNDYAALWKKINARPGAFAYLAHPQTTDYTNLFTTALLPAADSAIIGMAMRSGPAFSTNTVYSDPSTSTYNARYKDALKLGYHVGIGLDHDTHYSVFGRQTAGRLVVLAPSLTRANILDGLRKMRFYSSDDWNVKVDFNIMSQPMGSIFSNPGSPTLSVTVTDPDAEAVTSIKIYYGVPGSGTAATILTSNTNSVTLTYTHTIANLSSYYYYLEITQADGDMIWTSPIWYTRDDAVNNVPVASFTASSNSICAGQTITLTDNTTRTPTTWSWNLTGGSPSSSTSQNPIVTYSAAGTYTVTLVSSNAFGVSSPLSGAITVNPLPVVSATSQTICNNQTATISASGATSYSWSTSATTTSISVNPTSTSTYSVTGTDVHGCNASATETVTVNPSPPVPAVLQNGNILTSDPGASYQWYLNGVPITGTTSQTCTTTINGNYYVIVSNANGCTAASSTVTVSTTGLQEISGEIKFKIYPNPSKNAVIIETEDDKKFVINIFNSAGQKVLAKPLQKKAKFDLSVFGKGIFSIEVWGEDGTRYHSQKILVE